MIGLGFAQVAAGSHSQLDALRAAGCERIWTDTASGKLAHRPEWDKCLDYLRAGDELVVTRLSRIARSVCSTFCNQVHFFASSAAAQTWLQERPGASVLPVCEAFDLGRRLT